MACHSESPAGISAPALKVDAAKARRSGCILNTTNKSDPKQVAQNAGIPTLVDLLLHRTQANTTQSSLLSLPPEIRNRIYHFVLGGNTLHVWYEKNPNRGVVRKLRIGVCVAALDDEEAAALIRQCTEPLEVEPYARRHSKCCVDHDQAEPTNLYSVALLQTCSLIHEETALLPFQANVFAYPLHGAFGALLHKLNAAQICAITALSFRNTGMHSALSNVKDLSGLRRIIYFKEISVLRKDLVQIDILRTGLTKVLTPFRDASLTSASICVYRQRRMPPSGPSDGVVVAETDPQLYNDLSQKAEGMVLGSLDARVLLKENKLRDCTG